MKYNDSIQKTWNYEDSVNRVSVKVQEWKAVSLKKSTLTAEICKELYEARKHLDSRGGYRHGQKSNIPNGTFEKTWLQYLSDIGLAKSTVHRWLEYYEPQEQRLLSEKEVEDLKREKRRQKKFQDTVNNLAREENKSSKSNGEQKEEPEHHFWEKTEQDSNTADEREQKYESEDKNSRPFEEVKNDFMEFLSNLHRKAIKRAEFIKRIRLTGDNADHAFNRLLIEYLESLDSDSQRLEASYNGIKIFKAYIREYELLRE